MHSDPVTQPWIRWRVPGPFFKQPDVHLWNIMLTVNNVPMCTHAGERNHINNALFSKAKHINDWPFEVLCIIRLVPLLLDCYLKAL